MPKRKYKLELTSKQLRALSYLIYENPCESSCIYDEMQYKNKNCDECEFQIAKEELINKINNLRGD